MVAISGFAQILFTCFLNCINEDGTKFLWKFPKKEITSCCVKRLDKISSLSPNLSLRFVLHLHLKLTLFLSILFYLFFSMCPSVYILVNKLLSSRFPIEHGCFQLFTPVPYRDMTSLWMKMIKLEATTSTLDFFMSVGKHRCSDIDMSR